MSPRWIYRASDLFFEVDRPLPELEPAEPATGDVETRIRWGAEHAPATAPLATFSTWLTLAHTEWLTFADIPGGYRMTFPEFGDFDVTSDASAITVHPRADAPPATIRHLLLNQILPLVLSRRGRTVLHASAISYDGRVAAFVGRSGAGKSTLAVACARLGASLVSDDCLVVYQRDGGWVAVPSHTGIRLWPDALARFGWRETAGASMAHYSDKRRLDASSAEAADPALVFESRVLPLAGILYLPSPASSVLSSPGPLSGRDAVMALASEMFRIDWRDPPESRRHFDAIAALAANVPIDVAERLTPEATASAVLCRMSERWRRS